MSVFGFKSTLEDDPTNNAFYPFMGVFLTKPLNGFRVYIQFHPLVPWQLFPAPPCTLKVVLSELLDDPLDGLGVRRDLEFDGMRHPDEDF